jgi:hypothetical protein
MGHPQVRWSVWLMTQHGGMPAQLQGDGEGVEALPLNWVECVFFHSLKCMMFLGLSGILKLRLNGQVEIVG